MNTAGCGGQVSKSYFLSEPAMEAVLAGREDYAASLADLGFASQSFVDGLKTDSPRQRLDEYSSNARIVKAAICAGVQKI